MRSLGPLAAIPDGESRGFPPMPGGFTGLFAVRRGDAVFVYVNACPHVGVGLDWMPHRFLTADGAQIVCGTHGALFEIGTGLCTAGPCVGKRLEAVPASVVGGAILVPEDAGL